MSRKTTSGPGTDVFGSFSCFLYLFFLFCSGSDRPLLSIRSNERRLAAGLERLHGSWATPRDVSRSMPPGNPTGGQTFSKRRDYISNGASLCLGGLPKELRAAMRGAAHIPASADRKRLTAADVEIRERRLRESLKRESGKKGKGERKEGRFSPWSENMFNSK